MIASQKRAMEIVERIATKHQLPVSTALCARRDRYSVLARGEIAYVLNRDLGWTFARIGKLLGMTARGAHYVYTSHKIAMRRARNVLPVEDLKALDGLDQNSLKARIADLEEENRYLQAELDRLTGGDLVAQITQEFGLRSMQRCAIVLAILAEAYPRRVASKRLIELYEFTCEQLDYGSRIGVSSNLITKNVGALRDHFVQLGLQNPVETIGGRNAVERTLTKEGARLLNERLGVPKVSQLMAAKNVINLPPPQRRKTA